MNRSGSGGPRSDHDGRPAFDPGAAARPAVQDFRRNDLAQMLDGAIHDLRTPLGAMSGWLEVIETELGEVDGVLGRAVAGLRRAVDEQARMIQSFSNAFEVVHEPFDPVRRTPYVERLLAAAEGLDPEMRARLGSLEGLRGRSTAHCTDGGDALDDSLLVFLRLLATASVEPLANGASIDGEGEGLVVHLRSRPECVDALLAFCNGLNRSAVKRSNHSLPVLWAARTALLDSGMELGARVARRDGLAAPVDMVIWLRLAEDLPSDLDRQRRVPEVDDGSLLFGERPGHDDGAASRWSAAPGAGTAALFHDPRDGRALPTPRPAADGLAAVGALAAGDVDDGAVRMGPHSLSLNAILSPSLDTMPFDPALAADTHPGGVGLLPGGAAAAATAPGEEGAEAGSRTILIVDDQKDIREMLALWLRCHQFQVVVAGSAREARQRLAESGEIQAALIDIRMPEEDGISLLRSIRDRELERGERRMPALAITAQPSFETQTSALQAGFSGMLSKPLRLRQLIELVENLH